MLNRSRILVALALLIVFSGGVAFGAWGLTGSLAQNASNDAEVRIVARKLVDGRIEFALQQREANGWGERILPASRKFPANAAVDRWLQSSAIRLGNFVTLPIQTPLRYRIDSEFHSLTFGAGFSEYTGWFNTNVNTKGIVNYSQIEDPQLNLSCSQFGETGEYTAYVLIPWREHSESEIVFTANRYDVDEWGRYEYESVAEQLQWVYEPPQDWNRGGFAITQEQMLRLKDFQTLAVRFRDLNWTAILAQFNLVQALHTPVQANLDQCGRYGFADYPYELMHLPDGGY